MTTRFDQIYRKASRLYGVPFELLKEQGRAESGFNPKARSHAGALGIAQFMKKTGEAYGLKTDADRMDPEKAIDAQARHMRDLYNQYKDWGMALAGYNMGTRWLNARGVDTVFNPSGAKKWETANYTRKILKRSGIKSTRIPMKGGKMANDYEDLIAGLRDEREKLQRQFDLESDEISKYEMGASGVYDTENESPDLALMRELAQRAYTAETEGPRSNVAAQFAMLMDPNFAKVFDDATSRRVNAARQHFASIGAIARQAQSERQARASSRRRSDFRGRALGQRLLELDRQIGALQKQEQVDAAALQRVERAGRLKNQRPEKVKDPKTTKLDTAITASQSRSTNLMKNLHGDAKERLKAKMGLKDFSATLAESGGVTEATQAALLREKLNHETLMLLRAEGKWNFSDSDYNAAQERVLAGVQQGSGNLKIPPQSPPGTPGVIPVNNPIGANAAQEALDRLRGGKR